MLAQPIPTGQVLAEAMLAKPMVGAGQAEGLQPSPTPAAALVAAGVVVTTEPPHALQEAQQCDGSTAVPGSGAAPESYGGNLADPLATNTLAPTPACPAATAASVGWAGATGGPESTAWDIEALARGPAVELATSASVGKVSGVRHEDMCMTDADLLDVAAMLMSEEGPLDELP